MRLLLAVMLSVPLLAAAYEDDYLISPRDAPEADSYNARRDRPVSDYDQDGVPNYRDVRDNDYGKDPQFRDYDNDGVPNWRDTRDNDENRYFKR